MRQKAPEQFVRELFAIEKDIISFASQTLTNVAYKISQYNYKYFTAYAGLNSTASSKTDGVVVYVQTSQDGTNWSPAEEHLVAFNGNAKFFAVNVNGVNRIRVVADQNKNNAHDHAVWADAKLTNCIDDGEAVKSLESYDVQIKDKCENADLDDKELQQLVLQREFVSRVGQYALKRYMSESDDNKER